MLDIERLAISDVVVIKTKRFHDHRGYFTETYSKRVWFENGLDAEFVQDNHSYSVERSTIRGLHFQTPPYSQSKLVRVVTGAVFDVAVDIRVGSPSYGRYVSATLSAKNGNQLLVPAGFAHGFCTLEPDTAVIYKVTDFYSPEHDKGLFWNDARIGIEWPVSPSEVRLSERDKCQPVLDDLPNYFTFEP